MKKISITLVLLIFISSIVYSDDLNTGLKGALLADFESGKIIYSYNIDEPIEIASITKLMTYTVAMDEIKKKKLNLDEYVDIGENPPKEYGSIYRLKKGERIKLQKLIESMLIASANDSCVALSEHIVGSEEEFVKLMNKKAKEIGLKNTKYINSNGLPENEKQNLMSMKDILTLTRYLLKNYPEILDITNKEVLKKGKIVFKNTNPLLTKIEDVDGLKTGYTEMAGYCLVSTMNVPKSQNNDKQFRFIGITMGAKSKPERTKRSYNLLDYGLKNYSYKKLVEQGQNVQESVVVNGENKTIEAIAKEDIYALVKKDSIITQKVEIIEECKAPINKGQYLGKVLYYLGEEKIAEGDLIAKSDVEKKSYITDILNYIKGVFCNVCIS